MVLSKEEKLKILKEPFKIWPDPAPGLEYGPNLKQKAAFEIPHKHPLDIVLFYGGGRAGKTKMAVASGLNYMIKYPGINIMVGAEEYTLLQRTALEDYRKLLTIHKDWDHPLVPEKGGKPTTHNKRLRLINGSTAWFIHFSDFEILRGIEIGFGHIEEASLLKDKSVFGEVIRRASYNKVPQRQIILTSNPEEVKGWLYETFNLKQFEPDYDGPLLPIGKPCNCQFCAYCLDNNNEEIVWKDTICPKCNAKKTNDCPGNQQFWRVVFADPRDNPHLPQDYRQTQKQSTSDVEFQLYTEGKVIELRKGHVYQNFTRKNVYPLDRFLDCEKEMFWGFDFNVSYQCSIIAQEKKEDNLIYPDILDEIVIPNAGPKEVATEWLKRYSHFDQNVYLIFDPSAFNNSIDANDGLIRVKIIVQILENPDKYGFNCKPKKCILLTKKIEGKTKVLVSARVDSTNTLLDDGTGLRRLMLNPKCLYTIRSLEDLKWKENAGKPEIDTSVDKKAAKRSDKSQVVTLSHPTDALSYYIYKRCPLIGKKAPKLYGYLPGSGLITVNDKGEIIETVDNLNVEESEKIVLDLDNIQNNKPLSLLDQINLTLNESEESLFTSYWMI